MESQFKTTWQGQPEEAEVISFLQSLRDHHWETMLERLQHHVQDQYLTGYLMMMQGRILP